MYYFICIFQGLIYMRTVTSRKLEAPGGKSQENNLLSGNQMKSVNL